MFDSNKIYQQNKDVTTNKNHYLPKNQAYLFLFLYESQYVRSVYQMLTARVDNVIE